MIYMICFFDGEFEHYVPIDKTHYDMWKFKKRKRDINAVNWIYENFDIGGKYMWEED